jgi:lon-related putative ATP-dependent protease
MTPRFPELTAAQLRRRCRAEQFTFESTATGPDLQGIIGQERATRAIEFGLDVPYPGYNIYAMGPSGAGKTSIITYFLQSKAATRPVPADWAYAHNFDDPDRPIALRLPSGGGVQLRKQVDDLLTQVEETLNKVFRSDEYAERRAVVERELDQQRNERLDAMEIVVRGQGFEPMRTAGGLIPVPAKDGQPLTREQFDALPADERQSFNERKPPAEEAVERTLRRVSELEEAAEARFTELDRQVAADAIQTLFEALRNDYAGYEDVTRYLGRVQTEIAKHARDLHPVRKPDDEKDEEGEKRRRRPPRERGDANPRYDRYRLNVLADQLGLAGAPVVEETNPTYANLMGRVEMHSEFGTWVTNFRQIRPGALHRANGGYLILDARQLLRQPLAWEALKQALSTRRIRMEDMGQHPGVFVPATLTPEAIPLDVKVVLIGDSSTYYLLYAYDEQFEKLFKVRADFAVQMDWTEDSELRIAEFIRKRCEEEELPHFDLSAVAEVIEYAARLVEDRRKLTTRFAQIADIVREAAFWAQKEGRALVTGADVRRAADERIYRSNQYEARVHDLIGEGTIMVDTSGGVVGQVNALAVLQLGDYEFGKPTRITARTYQGRAGVINIEREARLSGRIHDKGMLILQGFLGGRFAQDKPLSLSASLAFEQSYDGIDGDSASSSEIYALLSSLSGLPIKQSIAVTGSVNQHGQVQAVGGVTAKIEGFFEVCRSAPRGLTGEQGVVIPASNVANLMLREEVVQAVAEGLFHIYPVECIDEGIEILTGCPAGDPTPDGSYPPDTVNGLADARLRDLAEKLQRFGQAPARDKAEPMTVKAETDQPHEPDLPGDRPEPIEE